MSSTHTDRIRPRKFLPGRRRTRGFSLLEVMIAVVVLATGLLALAALQGSLTRSSADAKVRGRIAAMLTARMDELRSNGYGTLVVGGPTATTSTTGDCDPANADATDWIDCARVQAGLGSLTSTQTIATWYGAPDFSTPAPASPDPDVAQFKRVSLTASWSDAGGDTHQLSTASDVSSLALTNSLIVPPDDLTTGGAQPVVRTLSPATAGVIPIAFGDGSASAASNPRPEVLGKNNKTTVVGTSFNVLTYAPPVSSAVVIQKRFENQVIKCSCQYGVGGDNLPDKLAIYRTAQWPAIWTGERYDVYASATPTAAPGQALDSGPAAGVTQSPLCQECCRDHHQSSATGVAQFDPERDPSLAPATKYNEVGNALVAVDSTASGTRYVDACRIIRVDGFWRTAADMYSRQFGLLATTAVGSKLAATGVPNAAAVSTYQDFVKDYLGQYVDDQDDPGNGDTLFNAVTSLNNPALIDIDMPTPLDERFLHGRGLYVDHLEQAARDKIADILADSGDDGRCPASADRTACILPFLPFTTINVTELAFWKPRLEDGSEDKSILSVATAGPLDCGSFDPPVCDPVQPYRGRTTALGNVANAGLAAYAAAVIGRSNAGVAGSSGIDTQDQATATDRQKFVVASTSSGGNGDAFGIALAGLPQLLDENTANDPAAFWTVATDTDVCLASVNGDPAAGAIDYDPNDYRCNTYSTLGGGGAITLSSYNRLESPVSKTVTTTCAGPSGDQAATATIEVPTFANYAVSGAMIGTAAALGAAPYTVAADGKRIETTTIAFATIGSGAVVEVTFDPELVLEEAEIASCTTTDGTQIQDIEWTLPWEQP